MVFPVAYDSKALLQIKWMPHVRATQLGKVVAAGDVLTEGERRALFSPRHHANAVAQAIEGASNDAGKGDRADGELRWGLLR